MFLVVMSAFIVRIGLEPKLVFVVVTEQGVASAGDRKSKDP